MARFPQMTVEQARSQYETAAATIPQIEVQIVQTENALSILLGRNPGPIARGSTLAELAMPTVSLRACRRNCSNDAPTSCRPSRT